MRRPDPRATDGSVLFEAARRDAEYSQFPQEERFCLLIHGGALPRQENGKDDISSFRKLRLGHQ